MFYKKKIESLENTIDSLKEELQNFKDQMSSLKSVQNDTEGAVDSLLKKFEGEKFSKDWEEFSKYKQMKEKLPDIETMYNLKYLKKITIRLEESTKKIEAYRLMVLQISSTSLTI